MVHLSVRRLSNVFDTIPLMVSERLIDVTKDYRGKFFEACGQFRFLIFVISSFDYILGDKKKKKAPAAPVQEAPKAVAAPVVEETAPEADDMELQAVITAAIAMYEEDMASASGDAYVARPIRRKGKRA